MNSGLDQQLKSVIVLILISMITMKKKDSLLI
mgnify:CR=1 FL=1